MDLNSRLNQQASFRGIKKWIYSLLGVLCTKRSGRYFDRLRLGYQLVTLKYSYLVEMGFIESILKDSLIDKNGSYMPWMNYSFIAFLQPRLNKELVVFEYGSGASTAFFAKHTKRIVSVETSTSWYEKVSSSLNGNIQNAEVHLEDLNDIYPMTIGKHMEQQTCDIIIVDGGYRVASAKYAHGYLSDRGVIIFDDSHRQQYYPAIKYYLQKGFKELTIQGIKPTMIQSAQTTILYRRDNCLGI